MEKDRKAAENKPYDWDRSEMAGEPAPQVIQRKLDLWQKLNADRTLEVVRASCIREKEGTNVSGLEIRGQSAGSGEITQIISEDDGANWKGSLDGIENASLYRRIRNSNGNLLSLELGDEGMKVLAGNQLSEISQEELLEMDHGGFLVQVVRLYLESVE